MVLNRLSLELKGTLPVVQSRLGFRQFALFLSGLCASQWGNDVLAWAKGTSWQWQHFRRADRLQSSVV